jgi:integrase
VYPGRRTPWGPRLTSKGAAHIITRHTAALGLIGITPHSFMAGWITDARAADISDPDIMRHTRHHDQRSLKTYDRPGDPSTHDSSNESTQAARP